MKGFFFDEVGEASDVEAVGPDPDAAVDGAAVFVGFDAGFVGAGLVLQRPFEHGRVYFELALDVHVPEATRAVGEMVEVGKREVVHGNYEL